MTTATLTNGQQIGEADREAWHAARMGGVGASEAAAACGESEYEDDTPLRLYLRKTGVLPPIEETLAMRLGRLLEPVLRQLFEESVGWAIEVQQVFAFDPDRPHVMATLDGLSVGRPIAEYKTIGLRSRGKVGDENTDELPANWLIQAHMQMHVAEAAGLPVDPTRVEFGVLVGGQEFRRYTVRRDPSVLNIVLDRIDEFWDLVRRRQPPDPARGADAAVAHLAYSDRALVVDGDMEIQYLVDKYIAAKEAEKKAEEAKNLAKAEIAQWFGERGAGTARMPDGSLSQFKVIKMPGGVYTRKASESGRIFFPKKIG